MKKLLASALAVLSFAAVAQTYPSKSITIVVPFVAGGPTDRVARDLAEAMRKPLGDATIVIENVLGAGSSIGSNKVAKANPDGYTILLNHIAMASMPNLLRNMPFKIDSDFEYLGMINDVPMTVIARPTMPAKNFKELRDIPTLQEEGLKGFEVTIWHGLYAPKGTPSDVVTKLNTALKAALKDPDFIKKQEALGAVVVTDKRMEPAEHKKFVASEIAKWGPVIAAAKEYID